MASGDAGDAVDGLGEVIPRDDALVAEVVDAGLDALIDGSHDGDGQVAGVGGRAYLVEDDAQLRTLVAQTYHGLDEVIAEGAVEPCRANNHAALAELLHIQLAHQLGAPIDAVGTGVVVLHVGGMLGAVEDVVGGDLYHPAAPLAYSMSQIGRRLGIQLLAEFLVVLSLIHGGVGGTVDDTVYLVFLHKGFDG